MTVQVRFYCSRSYETKFSEHFGFRNYRHGIEDLYKFSDVNKRKF